MFRQKIVFYVLVEKSILPDNMTLSFWQENEILLMVFYVNRKYDFMFQ